MLCTCCSNGWHERNISCALNSALWVQRKRIEIPTDIRFHVLVVMTNILWRLNQSHSKVNLFRGAPYAFSSEWQNYSWNDNIFHCHYSELMVRVRLKICQLHLKETKQCIYRHWNSQPHYHRMNWKCLSVSSEESDQKQFLLQDLKLAYV